jgi:hypothetical protein
MKTTKNPLDGSLISLMICLVLTIALFAQQVATYT